MLRKLLQLVGMLILNRGPRGEVISPVSFVLCSM